MMEGHSTTKTLDERGIIALVAELLEGPSSRVVMGIGDDTAVVQCPLGLEVLTTDMLVEGIHFPAGMAEGMDNVGFKSVAASVSDVGAMGARPESVLLSLAIPRHLAADSLRGLAKGIADACREFTVDLVGGDTVATTGPLVVNIAMTGRIPPGGKPMLRSGCRSGHRVFVTGTLGDSRAGLQCILTGDTRDFAPALRQAHWRPNPPVELGVMLAEALQGNGAMIDISDSLHNELGLIAAASGVAIEVALASIPLSPAVVDYCTASHQDPSHFALFSGEEYQYLFTSELSLTALRNALNETGLSTHIAEIGQASLGGGISYKDANDVIVVPTDETFTHFPPPSA